MSGRDQTGPEATRAAAAAWVVRLQAPGAGEADWIAFTGWLRETPGGPAAYDAAMALWLLADAWGAEADEAGAARMTTAPRAATRPRGPGIAALGLGGLGVAMAAGLAVTVWQAPIQLQQVRRPAPPAATIYATARGERRTIELADGTRLDLSGGSRVAVSLEPAARRIAMTEGEVVFAVAHDPNRPFVVTVGDRQVRDLGTEFDVRRAGSRLRVTVRRGEVEVVSNTGAGDAPIPLVAGRQLLLDEATGVSSVQSVSADEVFAWRQGRLIYRDQPLKVVVDDLNRHFTHAVRIEGERVAALRFTGVLTVDGEDATIRRLVGLLPISATRVGDATVLKARDDAR